MSLNNHLSRRRLLQQTLSTLAIAGSVSALPRLSHAASPEKSSASAITGGKAQSVIYLFMRGGMSHIDTFDPKPEIREVQGPVEVINTNVDGVRFTKNVAQLAKRMDKLALIRSMSHSQGNHSPGVYHMLTGYPAERGVIVHPAIGAWSHILDKRPSGTLPTYIRMGGLSGHPANGFLEVRHAPLPISNPDAGLANSRLAAGDSRAALQQRLALSQALDNDFITKYNSKAVRAYGDLYADAQRLMTSEDLEAFDISKEPLTTRTKYGKGTFEKNCLLARRLVEKGVRFIEIDSGGWDTHQDNHKGVTEASNPLDNGVSILLDDLAERGLLETTLVVIATEFGRSPEIDENLGRNHHPIGYTCILAGGGIKGGSVYGATDERGNKVINNPVTVLDFNATIAHAMGLPALEMHRPFPGGQEISMIGKKTGIKGKPLLSLFA